MKSHTKINHKAKIKKMQLTFIKPLNYEVRKTKKYRDDIAKKRI